MYIKTRVLEDVTEDPHLELRFYMVAVEVTDREVPGWSQPGYYVEGATVRLGTRSGKTTKSGRVVFYGIRPGTYKLTVEKEGYNPIETTIRIPANKRVYIKLSKVRESIVDRIVDTYNIIIYVFKENKPAHPNCKVVLVNKSYNMSYTDYTGAVVFTDVHPGKYKLMITYEGVTETGDVDIQDNLLRIDAFLGVEPTPPTPPTPPPPPTPPTPPTPPPEERPAVTQNVILVGSLVPLVAVITTILMNESKHIKIW